jgi:hypothetical protein
MTNEQRREGTASSFRNRRTAKLAKLIQASPPLTRMQVAQLVGLLVTHPTVPERVSGG